MDSFRGRAAPLAGALVVCLGGWAWALAATSMTAVRAAEARALGGEHTAEVPGHDELTLVAHDARLAALLVVASGLAIALSGLSRRTALAGWAAGVVAAVVANAALGRAVDGGSVLTAAGGLAVVVAAAAVAGSTGGRVGLRGRGGAAGPAAGRGPLGAAGALAAGTLPVLVFQGLGSPRYAPWVPEDLGASNVVSAVALALAVVAAGVLLAGSAAGAAAAAALPAAALLVLVERTGSSWQVRDGSWVPAVVLVLAAAPLLLSAAARRWGPVRGWGAAGAGLAVVGGALALVPQPLGVLAVLGGMLSMAVTGPAGATIGYDGLPVVGGGALIAAVLLGLHRALDPRPEPAGVRAAA